MGAGHQRHLAEVATARRLASVLAARGIKTDGDVVTDGRRAWYATNADWRLALRRHWWRLTREEITLAMTRRVHVELARLVPFRPEMRP